MMDSFIEYFFLDANEILLLIKSFVGYFFWQILGIVLFYVFVWRRTVWKKNCIDKGFESFGSDHHARSLINQSRAQRFRDQESFPPPYPNGWFILLQSQDLKKGKVQDVLALGMELVAWRGESGQAYVADAYCPHLGANLGVGGEVHKECITCPFHGWEFSGSCGGKLEKIPYTEERPAGLKVNLKRIIEQNGHIYLWHHKEDEEPSWWPEVVPEIQKGAWKCRGRLDVLLTAHLMDMFENLTDFSHFNWVHSLNSRFTKMIFKMDWTTSSEKGKEHMAFLETNSRLEFFRCPWLNVKIRLDVSQVGPGLTLIKWNSFFGPVLVLVGTTPVAPLCIRLTERYYSPGGITSAVAKLLFAYLGHEIMQDIPIWNRKTFWKNPAFIKEDWAIKTMRRWFNQFYSKSSVPMKTVVQQSKGHW